MRNGRGLKLEKIGPTFSSLNAMPAKITNKFNGQCTLMKFVWYVLHNSAGSFCAGICAFCASIFSGGLIDLRWFFSSQNNLKMFFVLYHLAFSGNFQGSETLHGHGIFWGFDFCPDSTIPVTWNPKYQPPPPHPHQHHLGRFWRSRLYSYTTLWG